jgi:hypothetical protein
MKFSSKIFVKIKLSKWIIFFDDNGFILVLNTQNIKEYRFTNSDISLCQTKMVNAITFVSESGNWYIDANHNLSNNTVYFKIEVKN